MTMSGLNRRQFLGAAAVAGASLSASTRVSGADEELKSIGRTPHTTFALHLERWWTHLPFLERIEKVAELGFPAVEFWPWTNKDVDAVAKKTKELGLVIAQFSAWGFTPGLNNPKNHEAFVDAIEKSCEVAKRLDVQLMTVVAGDDQPGMTQAEMHQNVIAGLKMAAPIAEKNGVTMILEPMNIRVDHKGHCLYGSPPTIRICEAVNSPAVKINWDLYHMQITEGDICGRMRDGWKHVGYLQLADHPGRFQPGTGEIHYPRVLREAHDLGYRGYVGVECRPHTSETEAAKDVARADVW